MAQRPFRVEAGHIMMFARAIGDPNPIYYDDDYAKSTEVGAVIAPPTFERASSHYDDDYSLRPKIGQPWFGSGKEPTGVPPKPLAPGEKRTNGLHAEQHYEYLKPVRAGDVLTSTTRPGEKWEKTGRSGTLKFSENITEYFNEAGEMVMRVRGVGVITEVAG